jgi:two-component system sensor histidine kinase KdpD
MIATWLRTAGLPALGVTGLCSLAGLAMSARFDPVNIAMVYVLGAVIVALRAPRHAALANSMLSVLAFDVLFVPPRGRLVVDDAQYLFTFATLVTVAMIVSHLVERARRSAQDQARLEIEAETERIRSTLLASISHDLRTPLAVIAGASSSLAEKGEALDPAARRALAGSVFEQAREMNDRVDKLLQMTRISTGALVADRDWAAFADIADGVLRRLHERLLRHRVVVEIPDDLPLVRVDAVLIDQALGNLLENAAKHTPEGTIVRLRARVRDDSLVVSVEDYGGDIDETDLERVFRTFDRAATEGPVGGLGLGLAICRAIVVLHGGRAWAERIPAGGMAFRFTLPLERPPAPPDGDADLEESVEAHGTRR